MTAMEQLKDGFKTERTNWETEKAALLKQAEDAEVALKPVEEELTGLKHQVNAMTAAVFGKYFIITCFYSTIDFRRFNIEFLNCRRQSHCSSWSGYADEIKGGLYAD